MPSQKVTIPDLGVADNTAHAKKPARFCTPANMRNVWLWDVAEGRRRLGSRAGLDRLVQSRIGTGEVQALLSVNRPAATGYKLGTGTPITGDAKSGAANAGHFWALDRVPSIEWEHNFDVTDDGPVFHDVNASAVTPDETKVIQACNFLSTSTGRYKCRVRCLNAATGATLWTHEIASGSADRFCRTLTTDGVFVFVCTNQYVRVLLLSTGVNQQEFDLGGWSYETVECDWYTSGSSRYLLIAFVGSVLAGTRTGGPIVAGRAARDFRSGVMRCLIVEPPSSGPYLPLVRQRFAGIGLGALDDLYEADHEYLRFSEVDGRAGHGTMPQGLRCFADGSFVVIHNNHGWGPTEDAQFRPDPTECGNQGHKSCSRFNADGTLAWDNDAAQSVTDNGGGEGSYFSHPHYNDILNPTYTAVEVDDAQNIYIGGARNTTGTGYSVYSLDGAGSLRWRANVTSANTGSYATTKRVRRGAIAIDDGDGNLVLGGDRNSDWDGASSANAHAWKLSTKDGRVLWGWDFGTAVSCSSVSAGGERVFLGTEKV